METVKEETVQKQEVVNKETEKFEPDSIVKAIITQFEERSKFGKQKYGTTLDRTDLSVTDWIQHVIEELMDATLYLQKLKTYQEELNKTLPNMRL